MTPEEEGEEVYRASSRPGRLVFGLVRLAGMLSSLMILVTLVIVIYAIFQRYVLGTPLLWGDELLGYILVAIIMLGVAEALRRNDHISIDLVTNRLGEPQRRLTRMWSDLSVMAFAIVLGWSTWDSILFAYDFGSYSSGYIEIATWIPQIPIMIGCLLLVLVTLTRLAESIFGLSNR